MAASKKEQVMVAKDRAIDELTDLIRTARGYWNLTPDEMRRVQEVGSFLAMPDEHEVAWVAADALGFLNGEEEMFFRPVEG